MTVPSLGGSSTNVTINAFGTAIVEAPNVGPLTQGYATFSLPQGITGYGVFRLSVAGRDDQEAVVPFTESSRTSCFLVWDETRFITGIAIVNTSTVKIDVFVALRSNTGEQIPGGHILLDPGTHTALALKDLSGVTGVTGHRGYAQFSVVNGSGTLGVLGLRFNGSAFTSIPTSN
jgi:hypothetical protein